MAVRGAGHRRSVVSLGQRLGCRLPSPLPTRAAILRGPDAVDAHPQGASPFGVMDLVGNVWQWTDEFTTSTRAPQSCAAEVTISRKARSGISRKPTASISTENFC